MAGKAIVWTKTAARQRREILRYWTERNGSTSYPRKLITIISERIKIIKINPEAFAETEFKDVREAAMGHFSIYYKVMKEEIVILAFWDNRQNPGKLLHSIRSRK